MIVLDANILVRAVLGQRVRKLLVSYKFSEADFCAPLAAFADAEKYLPTILRKRGKTETGLPASLTYLQTLVEPIGPDLYSSFEAEARQRLRNRDEEDWPVLALALSLSCPIWTEDTDFFGTGVAVWTSDRVEIFLKKQSHRNEPEDL